eukprot:SAG22_NODE_17761_length_299_cov_0.550000_1_plen_56_part_01
MIKTSGVKKKSGGGEKKKGGGEKNGGRGAMKKGGKKGETMTATQVMAVLCDKLGAN